MHVSIKAADRGPDNARNYENKRIKFLCRNMNFIIKDISLAYRGTAYIRNVTRTNQPQHTIR